MELLGFEVVPNDDIEAVIEVTVDLNDASKDPAQGASDAERALRDNGFTHVDSTSNLALFHDSLWSELHSKHHQSHFAIHDQI